MLKKIIHTFQMHEHLSDIWLSQYLNVSVDALVPMLTLLEEKNIIYKISTTGTCKKTCGDCSKGERVFYALLTQV
jgi:hypothetical protein